MYFVYMYVVCLVFEHVMAGWNNLPLFRNFPLGCFPVPSLSSNIRLYLSDDKVQRNAIRVTQFPCVLSLVVTGHKVQGKTLDNIILGSISKIHQYGKTGWLYVVLSRVKTLSGFFIMVKLCSDMKKFKPRYDVLDEMNRLRDLELKTVS